MALQISQEVVDHFRATGQTEIALEMGLYQTSHSYIYLWCD